MLLVANLAYTKWCKRKPVIRLKPWHMGTHLRVLTERYLMNTNLVFKNLCVLVLWLNVASALEGLRKNIPWIILQKFLLKEKFHQNNQAFLGMNRLIGLFPVTSFINNLGCHSYPLYPLYPGCQEIPLNRGVTFKNSFLSTFIEKSAKLLLLIFPITQHFLFPMSEAAETYKLPPTQHKYSHTICTISLQIKLTMHSAITTGDAK